MNPTTSPPPAGGLPPEDLDRLLSAFFRAELPSPWPRLKAPAALAPRGRGALPASRMALAASVAALLAGGWYLNAHRPALPGLAGSLDKGTATVPKELRRTPERPVPPAVRPR
jgi:hypothetical protein